MTSKFPIKYTLYDLLNFYLYCSILIIITASLPSYLFNAFEVKVALVGMGLVGLWRYGWWSTHLIRSCIYRYLLFPKYRKAADQLWQQGWRPQRLYFMMTTYRELPAITEKVMQSILDECNEIGIPAHLFVGIGADSDKEVIEQFLNKSSIHFPLSVKMVTQKFPGKRFAIGETLRAIKMHGLTQEDLVIFMDGDTFFMPGCLRKCLPFFAINPKLQALTTHEHTIVMNGPTWMKKWLSLRFAQRDLVMQSHSLSHKILTLTGRMSLFRGKHLLEPDFLEIIENDRLTHWLWGEYRFLSGDDKSTWYYLLKQGATMLYIPDAETTTIENIQGSALDRMKENLRRWSGNTLRNGARAIALGPKRVGFFIWWCLIDQRLAIWTMPCGLAITLIISLKLPSFFIVSLLWIAFTRLCLSSVLFYHARRIDLSFPFILYFNQIMTSFIKIYILFRLPQQKWKNRGDQKAGFNQQQQLRSWIASLLTVFYCLILLFAILLYLDVVKWPNAADVAVLFF